MISAKRDEWYNSAECTVNTLLDYILKENKLRDVQVDAIKTYLYLKVKCQNKPLWRLFYDGFFNSLNIEELEIKQQLKNYFHQHPCALSLYQYATSKTDGGVQVSPSLEQEIKSNYSQIDYAQVFKNIFYNVDYTDYLFSLPMGAGKTFLMACFIYLDLYFALNEPSNTAFAHNFIIFAPSGLKSSVIPSLKTIQKFNPTWVIPEPSATTIKRMIKFEVLDQSATDKKSNKIKNPNVQKIAIHQPLSDLFGLVAVTNAEKVILDRIDCTENLSLFSADEQAKCRAANELRSLIGKIPGLSIFIDEVHHAVSGEIKLRSVVNSWASGGAVNSVIGFSGTPYLDSAERIKISDSLEIRNKQISNTVYYYPLTAGIGNFLKIPTVKISNSRDRLDIVECGVREFLDLYNSTVYSNGTTAKLAIYCGSIENLEEEIYPKICEILTDYNLNSDSVVLKYHRGNRTYPEPQNAQMEFDTLDNPLSTKKIVLLVQIGKEGWDCKSLTGVILSQSGDCPVNMVLQTACRCLRQVDQGQPETALIYLNQGNADKLQSQLQAQHHINIQEFQCPADHCAITIHRYSRMQQLHLPQVQYYQLSVEHDASVIVPANVSESIKTSTDNQKYHGIIKTWDIITGQDITIDSATEMGTQIADFNLWLHYIAKASFNNIKLSDLDKYSDELKKIFDKITYIHDGIRYFSSHYNHAAIESNIRKSFYDKRSFDTTADMVLVSARLLIEEKLTTPIDVMCVADYIPDVTQTKSIIDQDAGRLKLPAEMAAAIKALRDNGMTDQASDIESKYITPYKDRTYHYLPYKTDSSFERKFLDHVLRLQVFQDSKLEIYYNGDDNLTEFKIKTYRGSDNDWKYLGMYTPDFLIIQRHGNEIHKILIVETKGVGYANNFAEKKHFMETEFVPRNNQKFGYSRFDFLYLQDDISDAELDASTIDRLEQFFKENT